jgi:ribosomal protein S18 acetylase RimI-like enzyme
MAALERFPDPCAPARKRGGGDDDGSGESGGAGARAAPRPSVANARFRGARRADAPVLAELANLAGEGLPAFLWARLAEHDPEHAGQTPMTVGAMRAARDEGAFSYRHAVVIEAQRRAGAVPEVAGMLVGYRQLVPYDPGNLDALPAQVRPLVELEAAAERQAAFEGAAGTWYLNILAVLPVFRRLGLGSRMLNLAEKFALDSGAARMSIVVDSANAGADRLYRARGFAEAARRPIAAWPDGPRGDWVLLTKRI